MRTPGRSIWPGDLVVLKDGRCGRIHATCRSPRGYTPWISVDVDGTRLSLRPQQLHDIIPVISSDSWRQRAHNPKGLRAAYRERLRRAQGSDIRNQGLSVVQDLAAARALFSNCGLGGQALRSAPER